MHVSASFVSKRPDLKPPAPLLLVTTRCQHVPVRGVMSAMCRRGLRRSCKAFLITLHQKDLGQKDGNSADKT